MSIRNLIFGVSSATVSYLIRYESLLQNASDVITKCGNYFVTKCDRSLLEKATVITKCDDFIAKCDSYYKCDVSYKMRQYNLGELKMFREKKSGKMYNRYWY